MYFELFFFFFLFVVFFFFVHFFYDMVSMGEAPREGGLGWEKADVFFLIARCPTATTSTRPVFLHLYHRRACGPNLLTPTQPTLLV